MNIALFITILLLSLQLASAQGLQQFPPEVAVRHLLKRVDPEYPRMAQIGRIQGVVILSVVISGEGNVKSVTPISGHPLLLESAIAAVRQWKYSPFTVDGRAVEVMARVQVLFSMGISPQQRRLFDEAYEDYRKQDAKCTDLLQKQLYPDAEAACVRLTKLAGQLHPERRSERVRAYQLAGHVFYQEARFPEALKAYQQELAEAKSVLNNEALGFAYSDVARGLQATGEGTEAKSYYDLAVGALAGGWEHIESDPLKQIYAKDLASVEHNYAVLLRQMGDENAASDAETKAKLWADRAGPRP